MENHNARLYDLQLHPLFELPIFDFRQRSGGVFAFFHPDRHRPFPGIDFKSSKSLDNAKEGLSLHILALA